MTLIPSFLSDFVVRVRTYFARVQARFAPRATDDHATGPEGRRRAILLLFLCLMANGIGQTLLFAILPSVSRQIGLSEWQAGSVFAVSATIWVFTSAYWGRVSDWRGRRPLMLIGIAGFGLSMLGFATVLALGLAGVLGATAVYIGLIVTRSIHGVFGSAAYPAAQAYVADRSAPHERTQVIATLNASFGLGAAIGPGLGAALVFFGVLAPLYFVAVVAFISAFAIWLLLPERTRPVQRTRPPRMAWRDPRVLPYVIFGLGLGTAGAIPIQVLGFYVLDVLKVSIDQSQQLTGVALMVSSIASLFAQFVLVQRFKLSARTLIHAGVLVGLISNLLLIFPGNYGLIVFALLLSGLGFGMARPGYAAASSLAVTPEEQGSVAGLIGGASAAGFIFAPLIGNWLYRFDPAIPFVFGAMLMVGLYIYVLFSPSFRSIAETTAGDSDDDGLPKT